MNSFSILLLFTLLGCSVCIFHNEKPVIDHQDGTDFAELQAKTQSRHKQRLKHHKKGFINLSGSLHVNFGGRRKKKKPKPILPDVDPDSLSLCPNRCNERGYCVEDKSRVETSPSGRQAEHPHICRCKPPWTGPSCEVKADRLIQWYLSHGRFPFPPCCDVCQNQFRPPENLASLKQVFTSMACEGNPADCSPTSIATAETKGKLPSPSFLEFGDAPASPSTTPAKGEEEAFYNAVHQTGVRHPHTAFQKWLSDNSRFVEAENKKGFFSAKAKLKVGLKLKAPKFLTKIVAKAKKVVSKVKKIIGKVAGTAAPIPPLLEPTPTGPYMPPELSWILEDCCVMCDFDVRSFAADHERPNDPDRDILLQLSVAVSEHHRQRLKLQSGSRSRSKQRQRQQHVPLGQEGWRFEKEGCCYVCPDEEKPPTSDAPEDQSPDSPSPKDTSFIQLQQQHKFTSCCNICPSQFIINPTGTQTATLFTGRPLAFDVQEKYREDARTAAEANARIEGGDISTPSPPTQEPQEPTTTPPVPSVPPTQEPTTTPPAPSVPPTQDPTTTPPVPSVPPTQDPTTTPPDPSVPPTPEPQDPTTTPPAPTPETPPPQEEHRELLPERPN